MTKKQLTQRELDIMEVFWAQDHPLAASDIQKLTPQFSINSIQPILKRLQTKAFIEVSGISQNNKALMREYRPCISKTQYYASLLDQETIYDMASFFVQRSEDLSLIQELQDMIDERLKKGK